MKAKKRVCACNHNMNEVLDGYKCFNCGREEKLEERAFLYVDDLMFVDPT